MAPFFGLRRLPSLTLRTIRYSTFHYRLWIAILLAGCLCGAGSVWSQESSGSSSGFGAGAGGASPSSGSTGNSSAGGSGGSTDNSGTGSGTSGTGGSANDTGNNSSGKKSGTGKNSAGGSGSGSGQGKPSDTGAGGGSSGSPFGQPGSGTPFGNPFANPFGTPGTTPFGSSDSSSGTTSPFGTGASSSFGSSGTTPYNPSGGANTPNAGNGTQPSGSGNTGQGNGENNQGTTEGGTNGTGTGAGPQKPTPPATLPANLFQAPGLSTGASSNFGATPGSGVKPSAQSFSTFTLPAAYGGTAQTFASNQGRFSRPHFLFLASMQIGFDDNVLQTPTNQPAPSPVLIQAKTPSVILDELVQNTPTAPSTPRLIIFNPPPSAPTPPGFHTEKVFVRGQPAKFQKVPFTPQKRIESFLIRSTIGTDIQFATRQTLFTMDARLSADTFFSKPGRASDPNGSIGFNFIHRFTSRLQFSATASANYTTQPDVAAVNSPVRGNQAYTTVSAKGDISYRWSKRFTTVSSLSLSTFQQQNASTSNSMQTTFGTEARYLWSPRLTAVGEVRYSLLDYPNDPLRGSNNLYILGGVDLILSNRFTSTVRLGESIDSFKNGGSASTPYAEITVGWRFSPTGSVSWNTRYGFEDPPDANSTLLTLRTGITATKALTSRLRLSAGVTYAQSSTSTKLLTASSTNTTGTTQISNNFTQTTFNFSAGMEYSLTRRVTLNASWTFTDVFSSTKVGDYYRNQIFFGADYSF